MKADSPKSAELWIEALEFFSNLYNETKSLPDKQNLEYFTYRKEWEIQTPNQISPGVILAIMLEIEKKFPATHPMLKTITPENKNLIFHKKTLDRRNVSKYFAPIDAKLLASRVAIGNLIIFSGEQITNHDSPIRINQGKSRLENIGDRVVIPSSATAVKRFCMVVTNKNYKEDNFSDYEIIKGGSLGKWLSLENLFIINLEEPNKIFEKKISCSEILSIELIDDGKICKKGSGFSFCVELKDKIWYFQAETAYECNKFYNVLEKAKKTSEEVLRLRKPDNANKNMDPLTNVYLRARRCTPGEDWKTYFSNFDAIIDRDS